MADNTSKEVYIPCSICEKNMCLVKEHICNECRVSFPKQTSRLRGRHEETKSERNENSHMSDLRHEVPASPDVAASLQSEMSVRAIHTETNSGSSGEISREIFRAIKEREYSRSPSPPQLQSWLEEEHRWWKERTKNWKDLTEEELQWAENWVERQKRRNIK